MYTFQITIKLNVNVNRENALGYFSFLIDAYRSSGQVIDDAYHAHFTRDTLCNFITTHEQDSLEPKYDNLYVNKWRDKLEELCGNKVEIELLGKLADISCKCTSASFYLLKTSYNNMSSPLKCGSCFNPVPLYKIPHYNDYGYHPILSWERYYQSCDHLWMGCAVGEHWSFEQMKSPASELSIIGREICTNIEKATGVPTYYFLYDSAHFDEDRTMAQENAKKCPSCSGEWLLSVPLGDNDYHFKCDNCRLVSQIADGVYD